MAQEVDVVEQRAHRLRHVGIAAPQVLDPDRDADVLGDRHVREQGRMLMDDRDPDLLCQRRGEAVDARAADDDRARVGCRRARRDVHQRRLAGAVLAEQGVDLARQHVEGDVRERRDRAVVLADGGHRERRLRGSHALRVRSVDGGFAHSIGPLSLELRAAVEGRRRAQRVCRAYFLTSLACAAGDSWAER